MNNLLSNCGLVDAKIRASDKDLPVSGRYIFVLLRKSLNYNKVLYSINSILYSLLSKYFKGL